MNFLLLATGHETLPLIKALVGSAEHRLVAFAADDVLAREVLRLAPSAKRLPAPHDALSVLELNAAIIDDSSAETLDVAKQLAANSVAILVVPRAAHGIEFIYQLGLIRDEQPDLFRLYPIRPWRSHPLVLRLRESLQESRLGRVHQVEWQREIPVDTPVSEPALLTKSQVDEALLADADWLKFVAGEFDQVTALRTGNEEQGIVQASVSMAGQEASPAQWSCRGTHGDSTWKLVVTGAAGNIALSGSEDLGTIRWQSTVLNKVEDETLAYDYGPSILAEFQTGLTAADSGKWADDLNRIFDLLEGVHRSLRRRRTVELYFDTPSERSNFKTQMTAVGCGVLMLTLVTIVMGLGAGIVATELKLPPVFMQIIRVLVFAPLFIFLLLQVGIVLSKPSAGNSKERTDPHRSGVAA